ncbi:MAG: NAD(P)H-hydrate dehydratase [Eubacteriales bacterium]|nr:NAD(P)H-hydrate dehydratase [Eubacteriales bacterium]
MRITGLINREYVNTVINSRPKDVHKGDFGKVLLIAGSKGMAGAAILSSRAALKTGSGIVKVCIKKKLFPIIQISVPEAICTKWGKVKKGLDEFDAIAIGPGMGAGKSTKKKLKKILKTYSKTLIIDADGLNVISKYNLYDNIKETCCNIVITPHIGEAKRLLKCEMFTELTKIQLADSLVKGMGVITVIKGNETLVAIDKDNAYINTTGNPGMATAGSGDVLTGVILSLAGQGICLEDAVKTGVFIHGMAGDLAGEVYSEYGMTSQNIVEMIPNTIKDVLQKR